jgi:hypothetical protein
MTVRNPRGASRSPTFFEIHVVAIRKQLMELVFVGSVRPFSLAIELWGSRLYVDVFHTQVGYLLMEERLELVAAIGSDRADSK